MMEIAREKKIPVSYTLDDLKRDADLLSAESVVSNGSPLIWLAKIGRLTLLKILFGEVVILIQMLIKQTYSRWKQGSGPSWIPLIDMTIKQL